MHIVNKAKAEKRKKERKGNFKEWISEKTQTLIIGHKCKHELFFTMSMCIMHTAL